MILQLVQKNHKLLRTKLKKVHFPLSEQDKKDIKNLTDSMYYYKGVGIAANQCGINKQIVIVDCHWPEDGKRSPSVLINPQLLSATGEMLVEEGCLSCPKEFVKIKRPSNIMISYKNEDGKELFTFAGGNLLCHCLSHELDHLKGKLIIDYV